MPNIKICHFYELCLRFKHRRDAKVVMRTDLLKGVAPQPTYESEKNFNPSFLIYEIDFRHKWIILNENLCYVDYQADGMSKGIYNQFLNSPNSFAAIRIQKFKIPNMPATFYLKQYMFLASSVILSHNYSWLNKSPHPWLATLLLPIGFMFSLFIRFMAHGHEKH